MPAKDVSKPASDTFGQLERAIEMLRELRLSKDFPVAYHAILDDCMGELDSARSGFGAPPSQDVADVLLQREQEFRALVENASDMIVRFDRDHRYLYVNPIIEEVTGAPAELFLGKTNYELGVPSDLSDLWQRELDRVVETGKQGQFRFDGQAAEGERYYRPRH